MGEPRIDSLHDPYEDQLSAARYKAERDAAVQELQAMRERNIELWMESGMANELATCAEQKAERLGKLVWRLQNRLARSHRREKALRKGMREWREKVIGAPVRTMSAYDLLPEEDLQTLRWVRDNGGLDSVKKLLDWVVGHCSTKQQLDFDFWLSGRVMHELGFDEDMADRGEVERRLLARLMPEGYEWPRYESGGPLRYEDRYVYDGREREVWHVDFDSYGEPTILNKDGTRCHPDKGERVNRPAPKALDADGAEIRVGDIVYSVEHGTEYTVCEVKLPRVTVEYWCAGISAHSSIVPSLLTHRAPVLAADGKPLREGETVYLIYSPTAFVVDDIMTREDGATVVHLKDGAWHLPQYLTHERPDSWERIEDDLGDEMAKQQCGPISPELACRLAGEFVRRCRALAERERGE